MKPFCRFKFWKTNPLPSSFIRRSNYPMVYFIGDFASLEINNLNNFKLPRLLDNIVPIGSRNKRQCIMSIDTDSSLFDKYQMVDKRDSYSQEKLTLLPSIILQCLQKEKIDIAIQYSEEYLNLHGGISLIEDTENKAFAIEHVSHAILPIVNWLSLNFIKIKDYPCLVSSKNNIKIEDLHFYYKSCLLAAEKCDFPKEIEDIISQNLINIVSFMRHQDDILIDKIHAYPKKYTPLC